MNTIILPSQCSICFNEYNHQRYPLILTKCGHTFCNKCLEKIFDKNKKEIICPICKLITKLLDDNLNNLPKNRLVLDLILYNTEKSEKKNNNKDKNEIIKNKKINFIDKCNKYEDITLNIEKN